MPDPTKPPVERVSGKQRAQQSPPKAEVELLREEVAFLKRCGIVELAVRNPSVMEYIKHWEARAEAAEAELARLKSAKECDVEAALGQWDENYRIGVATGSYDRRARMSAALAAGCAPMRAKYEALVDAARGLSHGVDWNNGTHAKLHGYRQKLLDALAALAQGGDNGNT